jgi:hypothetical protein
MKVVERLSLPRITLTLHPGHSLAYVTIPQRGLLFFRIKSSTTLADFGGR